MLSIEIAAGLMGAALAVASAAAAPSMSRLDGGAVTGALGVGEQAVLSGDGGALAFAGRMVDARGLTALAGQSSDLAYIAVVDGAAEIDGVRARPGFVLLIPPYGEDVTAARFDAGRLADALGDAPAAENASFSSALAKVARRQRRGLFFGRYARTSFNLQAVGGADRERARRSTTAEPAVAALRFSGESDPEALERDVAARFVDALSAGDADTVAALLDPSPFGGPDLRGGATGARRLAAERLLGARDWPVVLGSARIAPAASGWTVTGAGGAFHLAMRGVDDFVYVAAISARISGEPSR